MSRVNVIESVSGVLMQCFKLIAVLIEFSHDNDIENWVILVDIYTIYFHRFEFAAQNVHIDIFLVCDHSE